MKRPGLEVWLASCLVACGPSAGGGAGAGGSAGAGTGGRAANGAGGSGGAGTGGTVSGTGGSNTGGQTGATTDDAGTDAVLDATTGGADAAGPDVPARDAAVNGDVSRDDTGALPTGWWDVAWTKRSKITITDSQLKEEQTDFQVAIQLGAAGFDYAAAQAAGQDVRIVDSAGTLLKHQVDAWDPSGTSVLWVRLPKLTIAPTVLWLYYGNPAAAAPTDADAHAVWPTPYAGVWHLSGDGKDSTPHAFDGMDMVGGSWVAAKEARGLKLNGAQKDHIDLKTNIKLVAGASACTFSAWINPTNIEDTVNGMVIMTLGKWFTNNHNSYADFNVNASGQMISHVDPGNSTSAGGYTRVNSDSGIIKANEWAWVTYVIDLAGSQERFYKNGALASTKNATFLAKSFIDMVSSRTVIGTEEDNIDHWYTGTMDELRLETGMRSASWIAAQYRAMTATDYVKVEIDR